MPWLIPPGVKVLPTFTPGSPPLVSAISRPHMSFSFQHIHFDKLHFTSKWSTHPWEIHKYSDELKKSVIQNGILHPPYLQQVQDGKFEIVCGHKRLIIAKQHLNLEKTGCFVLPEDYPIISILNIVFADQASANPLSLVEKARFLQIAVKYISKEEIADKFSKKLPLRKQKSAIGRMLNILAMDDDIIKDIHSGQLVEKMVLELQQLKDNKDRLALVDLFKMLSLGAGKQRKLFSLTRDLAFRNQVSIADFLNRDDIQQILRHDDMNPPQKAQHLGKLLQEKLTPAYIEAEKSFSVFTKELKLLPNFDLAHSQSFEADEIVLSIKFQDQRECRKLLPGIKSVFKNNQQ